MQELAAGETLDMKYPPDLGYGGIHMIPHPRQNFTLVSGASGSGKSAFAQSCPNAYIYNYDGSGTVTHGKPKAVIWPGRNSQGQLVEPDPSNPCNDPDKGVLVELSWELACRKRDRLVELKRSGQSPFDVVVIDTVDFAYPLLQKWMAEDSKGPDAEFDDLYGISAWPRSYELMWQFIKSHRDAGYGVIAVVHLIDKFIPVGENKKELLENIPKIPDNLWNLLVGRCDMNLEIYSEDFKRMSQVPKIDPRTGQPMKNAKGQAITTTRPEEGTRHVLRVKRARAKSAKKRLNIPNEIELPHRNTWSAYEEEYLKAREIALSIDED